MGGVVVAAALVAAVAVPLTMGADVAPKLTVTFKTPTRPRTGHSRPVYIRIENLGPGRAVRVTLRITAPTWVKLAHKGCVRRPTTLTCALRPLPEGTGITVRIDVTPLRSGKYRLNARATARAPEPPISFTRSAAAAEPFRSAVSQISAARARRMTGSSWRAGCPVALGDLRVLTLTFWGFDGKAHRGTLIVHRTVAAQVTRVMGRLYSARFPIRRMTPVDSYGGDDFRSIETDNTSAFNCRAATGSTHWSEHAYGRAIDLDPLENPYVSGGKTSHSGSRRYLDRSLRRPGMIHAGDVVVRAFAAEGWGWGGLWSGTRDYQHFSLNAR